jgi:tetratricopeptide (TPR) repeat protein
MEDDGRQYTLIMSPALLLLALGLGQQNADSSQAKKPPAPASAEDQLPEEDESLRPRVYAFNPLQATREVATGDFYFKKKNYKAAVARYTEATKWNPQMAEAFRKLGEAEEKQDDTKEAREAYQKALEIDPASKSAAEVKKRLQKLGAS